MVFKNFIKRGNKLLSPYYYKNTRNKNENVKTIYLNKHLNGKRVISSLRYITILIIFIYLIILIKQNVVAYSAGDCTGSDPPSTGNWNITNTTICRNTTIILSGNLTVDGNLTFYNVTLKLNNSINLTYEIKIFNSSNFTILDNDNNKNTINDNSNITTVLTSCSGISNVCGTFGEQQCGSQSGCSWAYNEPLQDWLCGGTHAPCSMYTDSNSCTGNLSCVWTNGFNLEVKDGASLIIKNSYIENAGWNYSFNQQGIEINTSNIEIINSTLNNNYRLVLYNNANNSKIMYNSISSRAMTASEGIRIYSSNNTVSFNTINTSSPDGYGILMWGPLFYNFLESNIIITSGTSAYVVYFYLGSNNNTVKNNSIKSSGNSAHGIFLINSSSNIIIDTNISTVGGSGAEEEVYDIYTKGTTTTMNTILNTTFKKNDTYFENNGSIKVQWYLDVQVNYTNNTIVQNANVSAYNNTNNLYFTELTNSSGQITRQNITEYIQNATAKYFWTNYTINVTKTGYNTNFSSLNITTSTILYPTLNGIPNNPTPAINSTNGNNQTSQDLNCFFNATDPDASETLYSNITWLKNNITNLTFTSQSITQNQINKFILKSGNLTVNDLWSCQVQICDDSSACSNWVNSSQLLILTTPSTPTSSSTGGGGGSVSNTFSGKLDLTKTSGKESEPVTYSLEEDDVIELEIKLLNENTNTTDIEKHTITLYDIYPDYIIITIQSKILKYKLLVEETKYIDLNEDEFVDLSITLNSIKNNIAELTITALTKPAVKPSPPEEESKIKTEILSSLVKKSKRLSIPRIDNAYYSYLLIVGLLLIASILIVIGAKKFIKTKNFK